jgi:4-hydroxymandelate oxidase
MMSLSLRELEAEARGRLEPAAYDFFAGGADDEITLRDNEAAFSRIGLLPRVLRGAGPPQLELTLLGCPAAMPIVIAPTAFHRLAHPEGERATARAAARTNVIMIASMAATIAIEDVVAAARQETSDPPPQIWFQIYVQSDLDFTASIIRRAERAGCSGLVVTVDSAAFGRRERDLRNGFLDLPAGMWCENLRDALPGGGWGAPRSIGFWPDLAWEHLNWLRQVTTLPIVLKGVVHPEDARIAVERGIDALIVSNHGGRQLDSVPAAIDLLPAIASAVANRVPLLLDGGVRRGTDVVKALALGATAAAIGRPVVWALAVDGAAGVERALNLLREELVRALTLCGVGEPADVTGDLVRLQGMGGRCLPQWG